MVPADDGLVLLQEQRCWQRKARDTWDDQNEAKKKEEKKKLRTIARTVSSTFGSVSHGIRRLIALPKTISRTTGGCVVV